jgi:transcriptional regulator with XRE-family HTH domain
MTDSATEIINKIVSIAASHGIPQKELAKRAQCAPETRSRSKRGGNPSFELIERLATAGGVRIGILNTPAHQPKPSFRDRHPALVWSNSKASDRTWLLQALLKPQSQSCSTPSSPSALTLYGVNGERYRMKLRRKPNARACVPNAS